MKKLPQFVTYSEVKRFVFNCWQNKQLRPGQAVCNRYALDKKLVDQIYKETEQEKVEQKIWNFTNNTNYQNT